MKFLTWDTAILVIFGLLLAYSLLIRKHKSLAVLVSLYIGYVMAITLGPQISDFLSGDRVFLGQLWINANASPFMVKSILMILIAFLLSSFVKLGGKRSRYSAFEILVYAVATLALGTMFILSFMDPAMRNQVLASSTIVPWIDRFQQWILVAPVFIVIFFGALGNADE